MLLDIKPKDCTKRVWLNENGYWINIDTMTFNECKKKNRVPVVFAQNNIIAAFNEKEFKEITNLDTIKNKKYYIIRSLF